MEKETAVTDIETRLHYFFSGTGKGYEMPLLGESVSEPRFETEHFSGARPLLLFRSVRTESSRVAGDPTALTLKLLVAPLRVDGGLPFRSVASFMFRILRAGQAYSLTAQGPC
jgi:hypothetical protein